MHGSIAGRVASYRSGNTVNRLCASGLQAIMDASRTIACGDARMMIAGGVESMTRAPLLWAKGATAFDRNVQVFDTTMGWRFVNKIYPNYTIHLPWAKQPKMWRGNGISVGMRRMSLPWKVSRNMKEAYQAGKWRDEIIPVMITVGKDGFEFSKDEHPRTTTMEKLAQLKPAFIKDGTVTAGNSSGINDGASALLLANKSAVETYGLKPMAMIRSMAVAGVIPRSGHRSGSRDPESLAACRPHSCRPGSGRTE